MIAAEIDLLLRETILAPMVLPPGERLNAYEILSLVGAGGMGEVYRAHDTRLHRDVALKLLPPAMAGDTAAFERFEREAQAVAALSHPNILAVHDFGQAGAHRYVVFELLHGASLRERLAAGPLPVRKAIDYARQAAEGLAAAHDKHIIHRDIKPDNLFVTGDGRVKILDFGLAQSAPLSTPNEGDQTTTQRVLTGAGTVLGTVGYMAPEQIRGQAADQRSDLFALGCVLFEMCTGTRAFKGETAADTMSNVLSSDPPELTVSGQSAPPMLERIVRRCLEKQPSERFQSARDLAFALDALSSPSGSGPVDARGTEVAARSRRWMLPAVAALLALCAGLAAGRAFWMTAPAAPTAAGPQLRAEFPSPIGTSIGIRLALSPDGRWLAYTDMLPGNAGRGLYVRSLASGEAIDVPEGTSGSLLDWSPRSDALLFYSQAGELRQFRLGERTTRLIAPAAALPQGMRGAAWLADDTLIFARAHEVPLARLSLGGGSVAPIGAAVEGDLVAPQRISARTDYVLALRRQSGNAVASRTVVLVRLSDGSMTDLLPSESAAVAAPGYLVVPRPRGIMAVPFDEQRLVITGDAVSLRDAAVWDSPSGVSSVAASAAGVLAFRPYRDQTLQFEWADASGRLQGSVDPPELYGSFALSPDGTRIVTRVYPGINGQEQRLTLLDLERGVSSPIVTPAGVVSDPVWTSDGRQVVYRSGNRLLRQSPYGGQPVTLRNELMYPDAASPDGRWLLVGVPRPRGAYAIMAMNADGQGDLQAVSDDGFVTDEASFSPDGRLVSFHNNRTGRPEVYLSRFPAHRRAMAGLW